MKAKVLFLTATVFYFTIALLVSFIFSANKDKAPKAPQKEQTQITQKEKPIKLSEQEKQQFYSLLEQGNKEVTQGDWSRAIQCYEAAYKINPQDKQVTQDLLSAYLNTKNVDKAEYLFKKTEKEEENNAHYWSLRAENISNKPDSLKNIKLAVNCVDKAYELAQRKNDLFLLSIRAKIYLNEYKYYRLHREKPNLPTKREKAIKEKCRMANNQFRDEILKQNVNYRLAEYEYISSELFNFPNIKTPEPYSELPSLDPIPESEADAFDKPIGPKSK